MKKVFLCLALIFLVGCATARLERDLRDADKAIFSWYEIHSLIMDYPVPSFIDVKKPTEQVYFLHLPLDLKKLYISMFWKMHFPGAEQDFKQRLSWAKDLFRNEGFDGWRTSRGRFLLVAGPPDYIDFEHLTKEGRRESYLADTEEWQLQTPGGECEFFQVWSYWYGSGLHSQLLRFEFCYDATRCWRLVETFDSMQIEFLKYQKMLMAPDEDGWVLWKTTLENLVRR